MLGINLENTNNFLHCLQYEANEIRWKTFITVSYTHLDVYKRQEIESLMNFYRGKIARTFVSTSESNISDEPETVSVYAR